MYKVKFFLIFFPSILFSLSYILSSNGLSYPQWEHGRTEIEMEDINNDGKIDLLTIGDHGSPYVNTQEHGIMVYFGDGYGNWQNYMNGDFGYGGIAIGDVNNDGVKDAGYAMHHNYSNNDFGDQLIEVALGDGTGMNWIPWDDSLADEGQNWGMFATDFADINNDGFLDIGSVSFGCCDGIHIYKNNNDGTWTRTFGFLGGNSDMHFVFGDINNDGNIDFVVSHQYGTVYFGDGQGNFTNADFNLPPGGSLGRKGVSLGDVDNDGGMDLAFINTNGGIEVWCYKEEQSSWVSYSGNLPSTGNFQATQLFDMNLDGYIDVCAYGNGTFSLYLGNGNGNWAYETGITLPSPGSLSAFRVGRDADHNGFPDLVIIADSGSGFTYRNKVKFFKEASIPSQIQIKPVYPRGGEKLYAGSVRFIDWISAVPQGQGLIKLEISLTGPNGPWYLIASNLPDNGRYQWKIPSNYSSNNCYIRYTLKVQNDSIVAITQNAFSIIPSVDIKDKYRLIGIKEFKEGIFIDEMGRILKYRNSFTPGIYFYKRGLKISKILFITYESWFFNRFKQR
jgi:hypothetical protein